MLSIQAFQVAENINIKKFRSAFKGNLEASTTTELFYYSQDNRYLSIQNYGVIVFGGYSEVEKSEILRFASGFAENWLETPFQEDLIIKFDPNQTKFNILENQVVFPPSTGIEAIKVVMLNVAQSVGLDYYEYLTDEILNSSQVYVKQLETLGKFKISKKDLLKFIGKTLNIKNSIADNLYILDSPNLVWEDPSLDWLNNNLKQFFDTYPRFKDIDYRIKIVEDNLRLFSDLLQHRENKVLEYIIIVLILIEVLNLFIEKIL